jgi:multicomponent Na+:H+ antiporter subunit C
MRGRGRTNMQIVLALTIGVLYAASVYLLMRRGVVRVILGVSLLSQAVNLLIFTVGGITEAGSPFVSATAETLAPTSADPLPQALILTAIVISFGVLAFTLAMVHRADQSTGTDDVDDLRRSDS